MICKDKATYAIGATQQILQVPKQEQCSEPASFSVSDHFDVQNEKECVTSNRGHFPSLRNQIIQSKQHSSIQQNTQSWQISSCLSEQKCEINQKLAQNMQPVATQNFLHYGMPLREQEGGMPFQIAQELLTLPNKQAKARLNLYFPQAKQQVVQMNEPTLQGLLHHIVEINRHAGYTADRQAQNYPSSEQTVSIVTELLPTLQNYVQAISQQQFNQIFALTQAQSKKQKLRKYFKFELARKHPFQIKIKQKKTLSGIINFEELANIVREQQPGMAQYFIQTEEKLRQTFEQLQRKMIDIEASFREKRRSQSGPLSYQPLEIDPQTDSIDCLMELNNLAQQRSSEDRERVRVEPKPEFQVRKFCRHESEVTIQSEQISNLQGDCAKNMKTVLQHQQSRLIQPETNNAVDKRSYAKMLASDSQKKEQDIQPPISGRLVRKNNSGMPNLHPK